MSSGWIILDKPSGIFSRSAGGRIARMFGAKTFGHIGTLDPMASGVLPIALGSATKMIPFIEDVSDGKKEYLFSLQFGFETDSLDITGAEIARTDIIPDTEQVVSAAKSFVGEIEQVPPVFSAVHIDGRRAYDLARSGKEIEIPARRVFIYSLDFIEKTDDTWTFRVVCSRGTYVRALARDIAKKCGTIATVNMIRRIRTNGFDIKSAVKLDFLENLFNNKADFKEYLKPIDFGLGDIPVQNLDDKSAQFYRNGGFIKTDVNDGLRRVYSNEDFVGIGVVQGGFLRPKRTI